MTKVFAVTRSLKFDMGYALIAVQGFFADKKSAKKFKKESLLNGVEIIEITPTDYTLTILPLVGIGVGSPLVLAKGKKYWAEMYEAKENLQALLPHCHIELKTFEETELFKMTAGQVAEMGGKDE